MRMVRYVMAVALLFGPTAAGQILTYSPTSLTFPPTPANGAASEQFVIITNHGSAPAIFSDYFLPLYFSLDLPAPTSVGPACNKNTDDVPNLLPGAPPARSGSSTTPAWRRLRNSLRPPVPPAPRAISRSICKNDPQATFYSLPLIATTGNGPVLTFTPALLTFPATPAGGSSTAQVMVKNTGNAAAVISQFSSGSVFSKGANTCYPAIAAGATCNILFTFSPPATATVGRPLTADVLNSPANPLGVVLQGGLTFPLNATGTVSAAPPPAPVITLSTTVLPSITAPINSADVQAQSVTVTNAGKATATLTILPEFNLVVLQKTATCATLAAGATCIFDVYFHPTGSSTGSAPTKHSFTSIIRKGHNREK